MSQLFRKMAIDKLQADAQQSIGMKRVLNLWQLIAIGLGGIIGAGVFVLTGTAAANYAGPAVAISFVIAGIASGTAALCYAEFAGLIPVSGSAYTYSYAVLGEFVAWLIGWVLLAAYALIASVVAIGFSGYFIDFLQLMNIHLPTLSGAGISFNYVAFLICLIITGLLYMSTDKSAKFNSVMVFIKVSVILLVVGVGVFYVDPSNWTPFMPKGFDGVVSGAAIVFFAVFGYETLTTAAEEARNPQRDLPIAVVLSLGIAMLLYIAMTLVITGIANYTTLDKAAPVSHVFELLGMKWMVVIISVGAMAALASVIYSFTLAGARIGFAISRDGLLPKRFAKIHPKYQTPYQATVAVGVFATLGAGFLPIGAVADMANISILSTFVLICSAIIYLRVKQPQLKRSFRTPLVPFLPLIGVGFSIWLMTKLDLKIWFYFAVWFVIGVIVYLLYSRKHSLLNQ